MSVKCFCSDEKGETNLAIVQCCVFEKITRLRLSLKLIFFCLGEENFVETIVKV